MLGCVCGGGVLCAWGRGARARDLRLDGFLYLSDGKVVGFFFSAGQVALVLACAGGILLRLVVGVFETRRHARRNFEFSKNFAFFPSLKIKFAVPRP